jgi:hypothetical protein
MDTATIKVQLDGDTFDYELPAELANIDTSNPTAVAERNNMVREELAGFKPETAEGEFEWTFSPDGGVLLKVTRKTKTKGIEESHLNSTLQQLLGAPEEIPLALGLALTLRAREIAGRLDGPTLLRYRGSIQAARARVEDTSSYTKRVLSALSAAEAEPSPWAPPGF